MKKQAMNRTHNGLVKHRLILINTVIIVTSIVGILSIFEVARGVGFHESNIQHLGLTSQLKETISTLDGRSSAKLEEIRQLLLEIRKEPETCLASQNPVLTSGLRMLGAEDIFKICQTDMNIIKQALELIPQYESGAVSDEQFISKFKHYSDIMHSHSFEFRPLVSHTVDVLLIVAGVILALKGFAVALISILSSRSIMSQFQSIVNMEHELRQKNKQLNQSIDVLETQKNQLTEAQQKAEFNALHDSLTGLPNRRYLDSYLAQAKNKEQLLAVLHIDIDGFKQINDTRGHRAGDFVLKATAQRLNQISAEDTFIARVGGDEFVIVIVLEPGGEHLKIAESMASKVVSQLQKPVAYEGFDCRFSASVGVAVSQIDSVDDNSATTILVDADLALYNRKLNGKNGYAFYDKALRTELTEKKHLADEIHQALESRSFTSFFQPQVFSDSFKVAGVEALVRWDHPEKGLLTPEKFLPVADEMGVMGELDRQVFEQAYQCFTEWESMGLEVPRLSVNISLKRLIDTRLLNQLQQYDLSHGRVSFELLESILLDGCDKEMQSAIEMLTSLGIQLELDDFGSGHASILGLLALQPKRFKIDRQLIKSISQSDAQRSLVRSIIDIGKSVNVDVVAEGVETRAQAEILRNLGCNTLQGYYFSKPLDNDAFIDFMHSPPTALAI